METGIDGGSLSIHEGDRTVDSVNGSGNISKSEDLLFLLDGLLKKNGLSKSEIGSIVISDEPGSLTGLRIGLATARGLSAALSVPFRKVSVLAAMASSIADGRRVLAAIVTQGKIVHFREYSFAGKNVQALGSKAPAGKAGLEEFGALIETFAADSEDIQFVISEELGSRLAEIMPDVLNGKHISVANGSPSELLARSESLASDKS